ESIRTDQTLITADAGYHSADNIAQLQEANIPALIAGAQMRRRDERREQAKHKLKPDPIADKTKTAEELKAAIAKHKFVPKDFTFDAQENTCFCPAGTEKRSSIYESSSILKIDTSYLK
ncbi:MAG: hypothetical protein Q7T18_07465, partial [Sedimentisphaerales bacterium]|nr:hypothetical protein [Sedimentisphaerales bacterium]